MADIVWTEEALSDLEAIGDYFERSSPQYATTIVDRLYTSVEPLSEHPKMGRRVPEVDHESLRELIVEGYICESGVEREDQHRSGEPTEHMHDQALVGTYL